MTLRTVAASAFRRLPYPVRSAVLHRFGRYAPWEEGFDFTPPAPGPGETTGPPDFVGIGAQKAGTTWWYGLIAAHPAVADPPGIHKERHYLSRFGNRAFGPAEVAGYHGWFPRGAACLAGEWTPDYLHYPWVPPLLARAAPEARLLVLLRDPVERFRSGLAHEARTGRPPTPPIVADAVARGLYDQELERWWGRYAPDRILVLQYERCVADPAGELERTYAFLGIDPGFRPPTLERAVSASPWEAPALDHELRQRLVDLYTPDVLALAKRCAEIDLALWPHFAGDRP